jgi:hypothetical protein
MYGTKIEAMKAAAACEARGYSDVHVFSGAAPVPEAAGEGEAAPAPAGPWGGGGGRSMRDAFILDSHARIYADRVSKGGTLVCVHALFGKALEATTVLDKFGPIESGVPDAAIEWVDWDEATPLSSALQLKTLTETKLPFEAMWNVASITTRPALASHWFGLPLLSRGTSFSNLLGLSLLSRNSTPFSSQFGLPLLTDPAPVTARG